MPYFTHNQTCIHYREMGEKRNPLLLILPGNTASSAHHADELSHFSGLGFYAVSPDFLGTGLSDRLPRPWPLDWYQQNAALCAGLVEHLGKEQAVVCGTSGGAFVALWTAILYPACVSAVIYDSAGMTFRSGDLSRNMEERSQRTPGQVRFWSDGHGADWSEVVDADTEMLLANEKLHTADGVWHIHDGRLGEIRCPVLFSGALTDPLVRKIGLQLVAMSEQVPGSWVFTVNRGDHPLMWSEPAAFRTAAREFLLENDLISR